MGLTLRNKDGEETDQSRLGQGWGFPEEVERPRAGPEIDHQAQLSTRLIIRLQWIQMGAPRFPESRPHAVPQDWVPRRGGRDEMKSCILPWKLVLGKMKHGSD